MRYCPYAQRTRLVLQAKNIKHEVVNINLQEKPEWYSEKNPLTKIPTLEQDGKFMYESLVICDYLDEAYPERMLHSKDPWQKGKDRCLIELFGKVTSPMYRVYRAHVKNEKEEVAQAFTEIKEGLVSYEEELKMRGTKFFSGNKPGMLDYMLWPFGERLPVVEMMFGEDLPQSQFPLLKSWMESMKEDPAVKAIYTSPEIHKLFLEDAMDGTPHYDKDYSAPLAPKA